jgi:hypothetical protein
MMNGEYLPGFSRAIEENDSGQPEVMTYGIFEDSFGGTPDDPVAMQAARNYASRHGRRLEVRSEERQVLFVK